MKKTDNAAVPPAPPKTAEPKTVATKPTVAPPAPPAPSATPAKDAEQVKRDEPPQVHVIRQHLLDSEGPTKMMVPPGTRALDVHHIDGRFYLRTCEPKGAASTRAMTVIPAALGSEIDVRGLLPLVQRSGGSHFFIRNES